MSTESNLTDQDNVTECANPACHCQVQEDEEYCSISCEQETDGDACGCEHSSCQSGQEEDHE